jgi:hypothetical protein
MVELEMKFLEVLRSMVADPWATSAASSPIGGSPPEAYNFDEDMSDIEADIYS